MGGSRGRFGVFGGEAGVGLGFSERMQECTASFGNRKRICLAVGRTGPQGSRMERGWVKIKAAVSENTFYPFGFVKFFSKPINS